MRDVNIKSYDEDYGSTVYRQGNDTNYTFMKHTLQPVLQDSFSQVKNLHRYMNPTKVERSFSTSYVNNTELNKVEKERNILGAKANQKNYQSNLGLQPYYSPAK